MDVLNDIFEVIQLSGHFYFRTHFSPPWGTTVPTLGRAARFHHVVHGHCFIQIEGGEPLLLETGDFILVPYGASHILSHTPTGAAPPLEQVLEEAGYQGERLLCFGEGDPKASTQLICGHLTFGSGADHPLLRALPPYIHVTQEMRALRPWFDQVLRLLVTNVFEELPGSIAVITRLSEILFIEAVRSVCADVPALQKMMQGFADQRVGRAVALIHNAPAKPWTVDMLAQEVGMSRTRFAGLFRRLIGVGPIAYLTEWRLQRAAAELRKGRRGVAEIAYANGYGSPAAFTRAFSERFGFTPEQGEERGRLIPSEYAKCSDCCADAASCAAMTCAPRTKPTRNKGFNPVPDAGVGTSTSGRTSGRSI